MTKKTPHSLKDRWLRRLKIILITISAIALIQTLVKGTNAHGVRDLIDLILKLFGLL